MNLLTATIHNFRGVLHQTISLSDYSLLIGPNNSGKSTIIDALRAFYSTGRSGLSGTDYPYIETADEDSWIELTFQLDEAESESLAEQYRRQDRRLRVRKIFRSNDDKERKNNAIYGYTSEDELSTDQFYGERNVQQGKFGELVYIEAVSKVDEHAKLGGPSALRDLLEGIISSVAKSGTAYPTLEDGVTSFSQEVQSEQTSDGRSLDGFAAELNAALEPWDTRFELSFHTPEIKDLLRSMVNWYLLEGDNAQPQSAGQFGSGFQRYLIYSLVRLASQYVTKKRPSGARDFTPNLTLVLFEEPEAFLHPHSQEELARSLKVLAASSDWQVLCATHSSLFVSNNTDDIPSLIRLSRVEGEVSAHQITATAWQSLVRQNQSPPAISNPPSVDPDDQTMEMEAIRYFLWLNPDRAAVFFASRVLLVEGPTEVALINRLVDDGKIGKDTAGLYVMDCMGKFNIQRFMNLLGLLGVPHGVVHDRDGDKPAGTPYQLNAEIANSSNAHTYRIEQVVENLEDHLGLDRNVKPYRKPQNALYKYETGAMDPSKIFQFCEIVKRCVPG